MGEHEQAVIRAQLRCTTTMVLALAATALAAAYAVLPGVQTTTPTTVEIGPVAHTVDARFVSYVLDPASFEIGHVFSTYPYPVNLSSARLRKFAAALSPALLVINGGSNNCFEYDGFTGGGAAEHAARGATEYMSKYCQKKDYYGTISRTFWDALQDAAASAEADLVWHVNMAFGRGYSPHYVPWDPSPARPLLEYAAAHRPLAGVMLYEEVKASKLGFMPTAQQIAQDLEALRSVVNERGAARVPLYGLCDQDSDQDPAYTDDVYRASAAHIDIVTFSYYTNNAVGAYLRNRTHTDCPYDPAEAARFILDHTHRRTIEADLAHYVALATRLGKPPPYLIAAAPCTHAPEGTGWGAVNAHAGLLWYADALGRVAASGVAVFARQTIFGGAYGLLDNTTYLPTPSYYAGLLHKRLLGQAVLRTASMPSSDLLGVYAHCALQGEGRVALLAINFEPASTSLTLPAHSARLEWVLEAAGPEGQSSASDEALAEERLLSRRTLLNGRVLSIRSDGSLPELQGRWDDAPVMHVPAYSAAYAVLEGASAGASCHRHDPWWRATLDRIAPPSFRAADYDVRAFGAVGDGVTDAWGAIKVAIAQCSADGGGRVLVPSPGVYMVRGPIHLKASVNFHVSAGATLLFSGVPPDFLREGLTLVSWERTKLETWPYAPSALWPSHALRVPPTSPPRVRPGALGGDRALQLLPSDLRIPADRCRHHWWRHYQRFRLSRIRFVEGVAACGSRAC